MDFSDGDPCTQLKPLGSHTFTTLLPPQSWACPTAPRGTGIWEHVAQSSGAVSGHGLPFLPLRPCRVSRTQWKPCVALTEMHRSCACIQPDCTAHLLTGRAHGSFRFPLRPRGTDPSVLCWPRLCSARSLCSKRSGNAAPSPPAHLPGGSKMTGDGGHFSS